MSVLRSSNFAAWNFHKYREEHFAASFRTLYDNKLIHVHAAARKVPHHPKYRNNLDVQSICEHNHFITNIILDNFSLKATIISTF